MCLRKIVIARQYSKDEIKFYWLEFTDITKRLRAVGLCLNVSNVHKCDNGVFAGHDVGIYSIRTHPSAH